MILPVRGATGTASDATGAARVKTRNVIFP